MKRRVVWSLSVTTLPEAEEAVTELLARKFGQQPTSYTDIDRGTTRVSIFSKQKPDWSRARRSLVKNELRHLRLCGLDTGPARVAVCRLPQENWAESWKRHFQPIEIGSALYVKPSWSRRAHSRHYATLVLDPGLSFGTGQHPTTRFCLEQIVKWRKQGTIQSCLDLGTGSGILAIAAAKLGYFPVEALDCDPEAVRFAKANVRRNGVSRQVRIRECDVSQLPQRSAQKYSLICANLISNLLLKESHRIVSRLEKDGLLVLAGILKKEFAGVQRVYTERGLRLVANRTEGEWCSGSLVWKA